jgi:hypothetical protein
MSATNPWAVAHHSDAEDEAEAEGSRLTAKGRESPRSTAKGRESPVGLTLSLPDDVAEALTSLFKEMARVAKAIEENTKATREILKNLGAAAPERDEPPAA